MPQIQLATRINQQVKGAVEAYCNAHGIKINWFVEEALIDKLEELEDIQDVRKLRTEPTRSLEDIQTELGLTDDL